MSPTSPVQPRRTPAFATLVELAPDADVLKVRIDSTGGKRAELLAAYTWGRYEGDDLQQLSGTYPDDSTHTSHTITEFLAHHRHTNAVHLLRANDAFYEYQAVLNRPHWELC